MQKKEAMSFIEGYTNYKEKVKNSNQKKKNQNIGIYKNYLSIPGMDR